ncbi:MAG: putative rane protein, partial [Herbinix sp.]|nr:putative rane protein [Herbinix sp.]
MQHRITKPTKLLNRSGELIQKGYATSPILEYQRKDVALKSRLKEWDYYLINNGNHVVALTIGKSTSLVLVSVSLIDLVNLKETSKSTVIFVSEKKFSMPESSDTGDLNYHNANTHISFVHRNGKRELILHMNGFLNSEDLDVNIILAQEPKDSMVIATPFYEGDKLFYYNRKIIGMSASGKARLGNRTFAFHPCNSFGLLDWGRGVWPYHTTWYWSAAQGMIDN